MSIKTSRIGASHGFTLIELVITIVILGFTLSLLVPFFQAIGRSSDPIVRERTVALGQGLMDEVLSRRWDENTKIGGGPLCSGEGGVGRGEKSYGVGLALCPDAGPDNLNASSTLGAEGGENRQTYDDLDDYNSMALETDTFTDQAGVSFTYTGYSRSVIVDYVAGNLATIDATTLAAGGTTDSKRVRVTVTNPLGEQFTFVSVVCNL